MHHVLIQPGHDDRDKDTAEELLEEVLRTMPIAELKDPEMSFTKLCAYPRNPRPILSFTCQMITINIATRQRACNVSVQMIVLIPLRNVYSHTSRILRIAVTANGMFQALNT